MTLAELIEELQDIVANDEAAGDAEVLLAHQPNYPLALTIDTLTFDRCDPAKPVLWIAEAGHPHGRSPYAPKHAWDGGEVDADDEQDEAA